MKLRLIKSLISNTTKLVKLLKTNKLKDDLKQKKIIKLSIEIILDLSLYLTIFIILFFLMYKLNLFRI